ncbi:MAG: crossover junction endodeoxyribonuclease RuvC [Halofilum sp. (in: g-proteobacteria)]|nr:crossover junction endodeoxyribonuclease RuvC [Halofilum sp. (in: g-proteobacteria)]
MASAVRILGIDPGSVRTGYGIVDSDGRSSRHVTHGCIAGSGDTLPERLGTIYRGVAAIIAEYGPVEMGVEEVFLAHNPKAALKLGQARGAAICAGVECGLTVAEYSARSIKQNIVGTGGAAKEQVQHMVNALLSLNGEPIQADAADALAVALCHAHARTRPLAAAPARRRKSVRWK